MTEAETESDPDRCRPCGWSNRRAETVAALVRRPPLRLFRLLPGCARHIAWGYVDQPPLIALVAWLECALLGDSLSAIRFLPALSGAAKVLFTGLIARELGG